MDCWKKKIIVTKDYNIKKFSWFEPYYPIESSNCYGMGEIIRKMAFFPKPLPLVISSDHGPSQRDEPTNTEYNHNTPFIFFHSERLVKTYKEKTKKNNSAVLFSPFVFYRRKIFKPKNVVPNGTIAFPSHSTDLIISEYEIDSYIKDLKKLPAEFQPVKICLYYRDIELGRHLAFLDNNFEVFCAGHIYDNEFPENFYNILSMAKYATSNTIGSYTFYCIEYGIPFFIYGNQPIYNNVKNDPNCIEGKYDPYSLYAQMKKGYILFSNVTSKISDEQKKFVYSELGLKQNRLIIIYYVWLSFIKYFFHKSIHNYRNIILKLFANVKFKIFLYKNKKSLKIFTHLTNEEKYALYSLSKKSYQSGGKVFVEIGSYLGASSCFIAEAIKKDAKLFCIDTWGNHAMKYDENDIDAEERDTFEEFKKNTEKYNNKIEILRGWSFEKIDDLKKKTDQIDFLFIDGDHHYEGVKRDWDLYSPFLHSGSVVVFHDTGWAEGVKKVIEKDVKHRAKLIYQLPNMEFYKML